MISVAIIGLGAVTRNIHVPAYASLSDQVRVIAGCDPDPAARELARQRWHIPQLFQDPAEMIEKTRPDVVSVCTPPHLHREHSLLALGHGCHVFCEKPLAEDLGQSDEIIRASEGARRLVVVNNQFPYMKIHQAAKQLIGSSSFGRLLYLHASHTMRPTEATEAGWRGGLRRRLCFEFGVHVLDLIRFFFEDNPTRIFAHMPRPIPGAKSDAVNVIWVEFSDGRAASVVLDRLSRGPERYLDMRLDGESAAIHTSIGGQASLEIGIHTRSRRPFLDLNLVQGGRALLQTGSRQKVIAKDPVNPFASATARHFRNFLSAMQNGQLPPGNAQDNRNTLALVLAAYDSASSGRPIELSNCLADTKCLARPSLG